MTDRTPEQEQEITDFVNRLNAFSRGESRNCPFCGKGVERAELYDKIEPETYSLYVYPCGCRLGLWSKAPAWIEDVIIHRMNQDGEYGS